MSKNIKILLLRKNFLNEWVKKTKTVEERIQKLEDVSEVITKKATQRGRKVENSKGNEKKSIWRKNKKVMNLLNRSPGSRIHRMKESQYLIRLAEKFAE